MNKLSLALSAIVLAAFVIMIAPNILTLNRGKILRNIALWLGVFAGLALLYQTFGPGSKYQVLPLSVGKDSQPPADSSPNNNDDGHGFTPPKED